MKIRKFKNGKLVLTVEPSDIEAGLLEERVYHQDMFMEDLVMEFVEDIPYIIDQNRWVVYKMMEYPPVENILAYFLRQLQIHGKLIYFPLGQEDTKEVLLKLQEQNQA